MTDPPRRWLIFKWDDDGEAVGLCTVDAPTIERALREAGKYTSEFDLNACPLDSKIPNSDRVLREAMDADRAGGR
jgi:hypothetical protein